MNVRVRYHDARQKMVKIVLCTHANPPHLREAPSAYPISIVHRSSRFLQAAFWLEGSEVG